MEDVPLKTNNDDDDDEQSSQLQENLFEMTKFATAYTYIGICLYQSLFFLGGGTRTQDGRMEGADESAVLWWHPFTNHCYIRYFIDSVNTIRKLPNQASLTPLECLPECSSRHQTASRHRDPEPDSWKPVNQLKTIFLFLSTLISFYLIS